MSDYTRQLVYYQSIRHDEPRPRHDRLTTRDYLWRWDTDWFWCSRAFGVQDPRIRRLWPRRWRRSSTYWKLVALDHRFHVAARLDARRGRPPQERVVQDVEIPLGRCAEFLHWFLRDPDRAGVALPAASAGDLARAAGHTGDDRPWPLYPLRTADLRQRRLLVDGPGDPAALRGQPTGSSRPRSPPWTATSRSTPTPTTTATSSTALRR